MGFMLFVVLFLSCDVLYEQKTLRLAVATNDYASNNSAMQLKTFLESGGYVEKIIPVATAVEANGLVAKSEAAFSRFLKINEGRHVTEEERVRQLNALLRETLTRVTDGKLDKNDFHIFSHLIHQELALLKAESSV